jgi:hypothetical protein
MHDAEDAGYITSQGFEALRTREMAAITPNYHLVKAFGGFFIRKPGIGLA